MALIVVSSPAKVNLFLAVTGRRGDGFHDLVSVVALVEFGDTLEVTPARDFRLECSDPAVPAGGDNLVLKAAAAFAAETGWTGGAHFRLTKRIPMGAGLGGGSSNAVAALKGLNGIAGGPLDAPGLLRVAAGLGSDCPLFLHDGPVVMRGRGERVEPVPEAVRRRISGTQILLFKPWVGVSTPWAFGRLAEMGDAYVGVDEAEARLGAWMGDSRRETRDGKQEPGDVAALPFNSMERAVFPKYVGLQVLLDDCRRRFGVAGGMSGSGSACFLVVKGGAEDIGRYVREALGEEAFITETRLG